TNMLGHAIVLAFVLARSAEAAALMQSPTSVLEGTVVDSSGQVVPGAALDLRDAATNQRRRTVSDDRGAFRFVALAPGTYDVFVDRKSTRLNSSHDQISYAVFCLKKKKETINYSTSLDD